MHEMRQALNKQTRMISPEEPESGNSREAHPKAGSARGSMGVHGALLLNRVWKIQAPVANTSNSDNPNTISPWVPRACRLKSKTKSTRAELEERDRKLKAPSIRRWLKSPRWPITPGPGGVTCCHRGARLSHPHNRKQAVVSVTVGAQTNSLRRARHPGLCPQWRDGQGPSHKDTNLVCLILGYGRQTTATTEDYKSQTTKHWCVGF